MVRALGPAEAEVAQRLGVSEHEVIAVLLDDALAPDELKGRGGWRCDQPGMNRRTAGAWSCWRSTSRP